MKCEKCGKNEVNYYYTSNINGKVTEHHLCAECAAEFEKTEDYRNSFGANGIFGDMENMFSSFDNFFGRRALNPFDDFGFGMPTMLMPRMRNLLSVFAPMETEPEAKREAPAEKTEKHEEKKIEDVDPEISKRRRLNALRHQMKLAAHNEEYEKAAELRDQIKKIENEDK